MASLKFFVEFGRSVDWLIGRLVLVSHSVLQLVGQSVDWLID